ncbi:hypothetical protein FACS1894187_09690 [Synergistales bacterium]|nr:hypothetical protein FACS1894187_09690 [Synergistales bacterium]
MENTFYRSSTASVAEYGEMLSKMRGDLEYLVSGKASEEEVVGYVKTIISTGTPLPRNENALFWGFDEPKNMPNEAIIDFIYTPTYLTVSFMARAMLNMPEKMASLPNFTDTLRKGLLAATSGKFRGHGYEAIEGILECMSIFRLADMNCFVKTYPHICPDFTELFNETVEYLKDASRKRKLQNEWGTNYSQRASDLVRGIEEGSHMYAFVYGTLMCGRSNYKYYLQDSKFVGNAVLSGYSLYDLGSFPGIKENPGDTVKGEIFEISAETLQKLNELEGEGSLYSLKSGKIEFGEKVEAIANFYVYLHDVAESGYVNSNSQPWRG